MVFEGEMKLGSLWACLHLLSGCPQLRLLHGFQARLQTGEHPLAGFLEDALRGDIEERASGCKRDIVI